MKSVGHIIEGTINTGDSNLIQTPGNYISIETKFANLSNEYILLCFRDGTFVILSPSPNYAVFDSVVISYSKRSSAEIKMIEGNECDVNKHIAGKLLQTGNKYFQWEECIQLDEIRKVRKGCYLLHSDALLTISSMAEYLPYHPFCKQQVHHNYLNLVDDFNPDKEVCIAVRLVCNDGSMGTLYAAFNKRIMVLIPKQSNTLKNGIYITGFSSLITEDTNSIRTDEYYSFDAAIGGQSPIPIFADVVSARKHINEDRRLVQTEEHKNFIASIAMEKEKLVHANNLLTAEMVQRKIEEDVKEDKIQKELIRLKQEAEHRILEIKESSASAQSKSKSQTETLKFIGGCMALGLTLWKVLG